MKVWEQRRGTIRQFAEAIAAETGEDVEAAYGDLVRAFWTGAFDGAVKIVQSDDEDEAGGVWIDGMHYDIASATRLPCDDVTRQDAREAVGAYSDLRSPQPWVSRRRRHPVTGRKKKHNIKLPRTKPTDKTLAATPLTDYGDTFRAIFFDRLWIETRVIQRWRNRRPPKPLTSPTQTPEKAKSEELREWLIKCRIEPFDTPPSLEADHTAAKERFGPRKPTRQRIDKERKELWAERGHVLSPGPRGPRINAKQSPRHN